MSPTSAPKSAPKFVAGNWKMNGGADALAQIAPLLAGVAAIADTPGVAICPPATLIAQIATQVQGKIHIGGQDCHANPKGAHTGDIAADMLVHAGASHVILGHSERRTDHAETDLAIGAKVTAAQKAGLVAILCIGETLAQREAGETLAVVRDQLVGSTPVGTAPAALIVAYEPVWAIGTGLTPTNEQIAEVHASIRATLGAMFGADGAGISILYGGSVKASNATDIFAIADVDGALVGGASLKADDFLPIVAALAAA